MKGFPWFNGLLIKDNKTCILSVTCNGKLDLPPWLEINNHLLSQTWHFGYSMYKSDPGGAPKILVLVIFA